MKIAIVFSLLVSLLISSVLSGTPCPNATAPSCAAEGEYCGFGVTCNDPLFCSGYGLPTAKCAKLGVIGQACGVFTAYADCANITNLLRPDGNPTVGCANGTCQYTGFLGLDAACDFDEQCLSTKCINGTCQAPPNTCYNACPAGQYCNASYQGSCLNQLDAGANCTASSECKGLLVCSTDKKCTAQYGIKNANESCTTSIECSGCLGCRGSTKKCEAANKSPAWNTQECNATALKNENCTVGTGYCTCEASSSELRCQVDEQVISYGGCFEFWASLETCLIDNDCPLPLTKSFTVVPKKGCAAQCAEHISCALKCQADVNVFYGNAAPAAACGVTPPVYTCTKTISNPNKCPGTTETFAGPSTGSPTTAVTETTTASGSPTGTTTVSGATTGATGATGATTTATGTTTAAGTTTQATTATTAASSGDQSTTGSASSIIVGLFLAVVCLCF